MLVSETHFASFRLYRRSLRANEQTKLFSRGDETERDRSISERLVEGAQKMRSRNEAAESGETIARPCVKNEDIQMEI